MGRKALFANWAAAQVTNLVFDHLGEKQLVGSASEMVGDGGIVGGSGDYVNLFVQVVAELLPNKGF
jgi:hypothetical protein